MSIYRDAGFYQNLYNFFLNGRYRDCDCKEPHCILILPTVDMGHYLGRLVDMWISIECPY